MARFLCVPTIRKYDLLLNLIKAASRMAPPPDEILVVDNGGSFQPPQNSEVKVSVIRPGKNLGVAESWNRMLDAALTIDNTVLVTNDDVTLNPKAFENVEAHKSDAHIVVASGFEAFCVTWAARELIGRFDATFFPAYYEDNDYARRAKLKGIGIKHLGREIVESHVGSATIKSGFSVDSHSNHLYYQRKWGGSPNQETRPFPVHLDDEYRRLLSAPTDIQNHLPRLRSLASQCESVVEFGTRTAVSTTAILHGQPRKFTAYDINRSDRAVWLREVSGRTHYRFVTADTRQIEIEPCDLLFIDTLHVYEQLSAELALHADKVRSRIAMHDTVTFGTSGEVPGSKGLRPAIQEFLAKGGWSVESEYADSNGLTVLKRM